MEIEELGLGSTEACQMAIGIPCEECIWEEACKGNDEEINEEEGDVEL